MKVDLADIELIEPNDEFLLDKDIESLASMGCEPIPSGYWHR